jgi:predicted nucleic acid-binding protein
VRRRHPDVDDGEIRLMLADEIQELGRVTGLADYLIASLLEQAGKALAHQNVIVGHDDSRAARIDVGHRESIPQHDRPNQAKSPGGE